MSDDLEWEIEELAMTALDLKWTRTRSESQVKALVELIDKRIEAALAKPPPNTGGQP